MNANLARSRPDDEPPLHKCGRALAAGLASLSVGQVQLSLPKFAFQTSLELAPLLASMGMPDRFGRTKANLSGMDGARDLYVGAVVQQPTVQVDESGTVATAATSASGASLSRSISPSSFSSATGKAGMPLRLLNFV